MLRKLTIPRENCAGKWNLVKKQAFHGKKNSGKIFLSYLSKIAWEIARGMRKGQQNDRIGGKILPKNVVAAEKILNGSKLTK